MQAASTDELCLVRRRSFFILVRMQAGSTIAAQASVVALRQSCLDELGLRNPSGSVCWLHDGARPASDPTRYVVTRSPPIAGQAGPTT